MPLAQATLFDINPREKHAQAMALFGGGIMIGPILGPVLGGWLTDSFNWRWVFLVNIPIGVICALMMLRFMPTTETLTAQVRPVRLCSARRCARRLQLMLDRGQHKDWFDSAEIWIEAGLLVAAFWMFVVHTMTTKQPLFERSMFADRNFATACCS